MRVAQNIPDVLTGLPLFRFKDGELPYWGRKGWRPWSLTPWGSEQNVFPACEDKGNTHAKEGNRGQTLIRLLGSEDKAVALGTEGLGCPSEHLVEKPPTECSTGTTPSGHPHRGLDPGRDKDSGWLALCCSKGMPALPIKDNGHSCTVERWPAVGVNTLQPGCKPALG